MELGSEKVLIVLIVGAGVVVGLMVLAALVVAWTRKAQKQALSQVDESMELSREGIALGRRGLVLQEKTVALVEVMIQNQQEIIELLRSKDDRASESRIRA